MPNVEVKLNAADLALIGTDNPADIEEVLGMLAEVGLSEVVDQVGPLPCAPTPERGNDQGGAHAG